ncbi:MAG: NUDIX hydrolase [Gemmatimonadota bacterium]
MDFERRERETIYEGRMLRLYKDRVAVRPDGRGEQVLELEQVEHPGAACAVAFLDPERILLLRQFRYSAGGEIWEVPAGKLDGGEPAEACIRRELVEETGYHPGTLEHLGTLIMTPGFSDERCAVFLARDLEKRESAVADDEFLQVLELPFEEAVGMVEEGVIQDAKTVAGLLLVARRRAR